MFQFLKHRSCMMRHPMSRLIWFRRFQIYLQSAKTNPPVRPLASEQSTCLTSSVHSAVAPEPPGHLTKYCQIPVLLTRRRLLPAFLLPSFPLLVPQYGFLLPRLPCGLLPPQPPCALLPPRLPCGPLPPQPPCALLPPRLPCGPLLPQPPFGPLLPRLPCGLLPPQPPCGLLPPQPPCGLLLPRLPCGLLLPRLPCGLLPPRLPCGLLLPQPPCEPLLPRLPCGLLPPRLPCGPPPDALCHIAPADNPSTLYAKDLRCWRHKPGSASVKSDS